MKRVFYILGILAFSLNSFAQIWTKPSPLVISGLPSEYLNIIQDLILHSSGELWCKFGAYDTAQHQSTSYIAHYDSKREEWINPIKIPEEVAKYVLGGRLVEDKKGRLWIIGSGGSGPDLYGCYYDGHSFSDLIEITGGPCWNIPVYACRDSAGNIWVVWTYPGYGWGWELGYNWYDGETWHSPSRLTDHGETLYDYELSSLLTDKNGRVWVAWTGYGVFEDPPVESYLKYYDGKEWSDSICIPGQGGPREPKLACDSRERIWVTWLSHYAKDTLAIYASFYKGGEWSAPVFISKEVPFTPVVDFYPYPAIAVDGKDRVWVVWNSTYSDSFGNIHFRYYNWKEWSEPTPIYQKPHVNYSLPSLIVDKKGKVWCWWSAIDTSITRRIYYISHTTEMGVKEESRNNTIKLELLGISPNPFNTVTSIKWQVPSGNPISLQVYDATGRLVRTLTRTQNQEPKSYTAVWNGNDDKDKPLPSGVYFCELKTGDYRITKKVILVR